MHLEQDVKLCISNSLLMYLIQFTFMQFLFLVSWNKTNRWWWSVEVNGQKAPSRQLQFRFCFCNLLCNIPLLWYAPFLSCYSNRDITQRLLQPKLVQYIGVHCLGRLYLPERMYRMHVPTKLLVIQVTGWLSRVVPPFKQWKSHIIFLNNGDSVKSDYREGCIAIFAGNKQLMESIWVFCKVLD